MVAALIIAGLSFNHNLGYWPYGLTTQQHSSASRSVPPGPARSEGGSGLSYDLIRGGISLAAFLSVAILYYRGRKAGARAHLPSEEKEVVEVNRLAGAESNAKLRELEQDKLRVREVLWKLKSDAREIKRCWPGSDFEQRPAAKEAWITVHPGISARLRPGDTLDDRGWLQDAIKWHEQFSAVREYHKITFTFQPV